MYQVICCPDRKAYSCLPKWLPQDSTSSGERFDLTFALETALRDTLRHTGGVLGLSSVLYKNVNRPHSHSSELPEKKHANVSRQIRKCAFSALRREVGLSVGCALRWQLSVWGKSVCLGGDWCWCVCVCSCRRERRCRRREKWETTEDEEEQWMYSAVIHKVESTTKLLATV